MIDASLASGGERGFPLAVGRYLAAKYGHGPAQLAGARQRILEVLAALQRRLGDGEYFGGAAPDALDIYTASFLTPLAGVTSAGRSRCDGHRTLASHGVSNHLYIPDLARSSEASRIVKRW